MLIDGVRCPLDLRLRNRFAQCFDISRPGFITVQVQNPDGQVSNTIKVPVRNSRFRKVCLPATIGVGHRLWIRVHSKSRSFAALRMTWGFDWLNGVCG